MTEMKRKLSVANDAAHLFVIQKSLSMKTYSSNTPIMYSIRNIYVFLHTSTRSTTSRDAERTLATYTFTAQRLIGESEIKLT